jgi:hypothetical protein
MQLLIMQFSLTSCHFIPLRSKYSPKHPVFKYPQYVLVTKEIKSTSSTEGVNDLLYDSFFGAHLAISIQQKEGENNNVTGKKESGGGGGGFVE